MARVQIHPLVLKVNGSEADAAGTVLATGAGNGVYVADSEVIPELLVLRVTNAGGAAAHVTIPAGDSFPLAPSSGQGPLAVTVAAGATEWVGPFESARFIQSDSTLAVDTDAAVTVTAFKVARHV